MVAKRKEPDHLPAYLVPVHEICLFHYQVLVELIRSAEKHGSFNHGFEFRDEASFLEWLATGSRNDERALFLRRTIFPALLTDFLQFLHGALDNSRAGSLNVTYALLRKPLQENLFLLEVIAADIDKFALHFTENPLGLDSQKAGGVEAHAKRIEKVILTLREEDIFDATYIAQLRYDKKADDGFDGACNLAMHLFTGHHAISTPPLNINFIFSGLDEKITQWHYLYSRLPYLLFYVRRLAEHIYASFEDTTDPVYLAEIERRASAATLLWFRMVEEGYSNPSIERFAMGTQKRLYSECEANGFHIPTERDLARMFISGAWPGESTVRVRSRHMRYFFLERIDRMVQRLKPEKTS